MNQNERKDLQTEVGEVLAATVTLLAHAKHEVTGADSGKLVDLLMTVQRLAQGVASKQILVSLPERPAIDDIQIGESDDGE